MTNWNPSPTTLGPEIIPDAAGATNLPFGMMALAHMTSTVEETISEIHVPTPGGNPGTNGVVAVDVYDFADYLTTPALTVATPLPSADAGGTGGWVKNPGQSTTNLYQNIASNPDNPNLDNSIVETSGGVGRSAYFNINTASFSTAGRRIVSVGVRMVCVGGSIRASLRGPGGRTGTMTTGSNVSGRRTVTLDFGEICPWTGAGWTEDDIRLFASDALVAVARDDRATGWASPQIYALGLRVEQRAETRLAYGTMRPNASSTRLTFAMTDAATGDPGWEKPGSGRHVYMIRGARGGPGQTGVAPGLPRVRPAWWEGDLPPGFGIHGTETALIGNKVFVHSVGRTMDERRVSALVLKRDDDTFSVDGSEYSGISDLRSIRQIFPAGDGGTYGSITAVVMPPLGADPEPVTFQVQTMAGAAVGSRVSVSRADLAREGRQMRNGWWYIRRPIPNPAVLDAATQYRVQVGGSSDWRVMILGGSNEHGDAGYGGFDGYVDYFGQTGARDAIITLGESPDPVTGLNVEARELPLARKPPTGMCDAFETLPYVRISWDITGLTDAEFGSYEVERYDTPTQRWERIAVFTNRALTAVDDHEARLGVEAHYRVRVSRADGTPAKWTGDMTGSSSVTVPAPASPGLWFTANERPDLGLAYMDVYGSGRPDRDYRLIDGSSTSYVRYFGRDYQVAHRPTEHDGVSFSRRLLVDAGSVVTPSMGAFDPMRELTTADLSAITVRDHEGNRWWSWVDATAATATIGGHRYIDVSVTEISGSPVPVGSSNLTLGGGWVNLRGGFAADPTGAYVSRATDAGAMAVIETGHADGAILAELSDPVPTTNAMGVAFRVVDEDNYLAVVRNASFGQARFHVVSGGAEETFTIGGLPARFTVSFEGSSTNGGTVVRVVGGGTERASFTVEDETFDGASRHGIVFTGGSVPTNGARWTDWTFYEPGGTLGPDWESWGGSTWRIEDSAAVRFAVGGDTKTSVTVRDVGSADVRVRVGIRQSLDRTRIIFRALDEDNYLYVRASATFNRWTFYSRIAGVEEQIAVLGGPASGQVTAEVFLVGDKVRFRFNGSLSRRSGTDEQTFILPAEVAFLEDATRHGFGDDGGHADGESALAFTSFSAVPLRSFAVSGSALMMVPSQLWIGRQVDVFQLQDESFTTGPILGETDAAALMWGVNDAISMSAEWFGEGLAAVISRLRAVHAVDAFVVAPESGTWTRVYGDGHNSGDSWMESDDPGASYLFDLPDTGTVGAVTIGFIAIDGGGTARVTVNGTPTIVETDRGEWGFEPIFPVRVKTPGSGPYIIEIEVVSGTVAIDSFWFEPAGPGGPRIAVANVARFLQGADFTATGSTQTTVTSLGAGWTEDEHVGATARIYSGPGAIQDRTVVSNTSSMLVVDPAWSTPPVAGQSRIHVNQVGSPWGAITDAKIAEMNATIAQVAAEFPNTTVVDIDDVLDRDPALFSGDKIHPSLAGHDALGAAFAARLGATTTFDSLWVFGHSYAAGQGGGASGFDYQLARRLRFSVRVDDGFDHPDERGFELDAGFDQ